MQQYWIRPNTPALQGPSLGQFITHTPPNLYQLSLHSWKCFGKLSWGHCGGTIPRFAFIPPDAVQSYCCTHEMHQAHSNKDQLPGGTDVSRSFCPKQGQLWDQVKLSGLLSLQLLKKHPRTEPVQVLCAACSNVNANLSWNRISFVQSDTTGQHKPLKDCEEFWCKKILKSDFQHKQKWNKLSS